MLRANLVVVTEIQDGSTVQMLHAEACFKNA
jgi:hypothetical protein